MPDLTLTKTRIQAGTYEGLIRSLAEREATPDLQVYYLQKPVGEVSIKEDPSLEQTWHFKVKLPADVLSDGVQTISIVDENSSETLDSFAIAAGEPLDDDLRAEIGLLRDELDMLKKAFRRHCLETP
jgi:hypothetical protein